MISHKLEVEAFWLGYKVVLQYIRLAAFIAVEENANKVFCSGLIRLAASIAVEENAKSVNNASTSLGASTIEEEDDDYDEDEEMILVSLHF